MLNANKICLNVSNIELIYLIHLNKQPDHDLKSKLNGEKLYQTDSVKYLGIRFDKYLTWKHQINVVIKLNKANAMLFKIRHYVDIKTLNLIYHANFDSHLSHPSLGWVTTYPTGKSLRPFFESEKLTQVLFSETQRFENLVTKLHFRTAY